MDPLKPKCPACKKEWCTKPWCDGTPYPQDIAKMEATLPHLIVITIGDFSGDGHDKSIDYYYRCNKSRDDVREAYFAAKEARPDVCPANYCAEYDEHEIPEDVATKLRGMGAPMPSDLAWVGPDEMAALSVWFCCLGDPSLDFEPIEAPSLMFCGKDAKGRYSDSIGYGCFS